MGKHGPCYHCGVTSTPLWRNGPPEKPILCNACGSRWRTKGTLANYTPLHARAEHEEFEDYRISKVKTISIKNKEPKVIKRKFDHNNNDIAEFRGVPLDYSQGFHKGFDKDTSNGSSSGSAISNLESCAQYGSADASDLTGPSQPAVWDTMVPSKKRTCVTRSKPSPVEKLTKDLYAIWHEQWSSLSGSSEEELLLESGKPMVSVEIGHGSVLIRHPNSIAREEESEASSLSIDNKKHTVNSRHTTFPGLMEDTGVNSSCRGIEKIKKPANPGTEQERIKRGKDQLETIQILAHHNSPLCYIDLQDVLNMDKFLSHLTTEEQKQLLNFLSPVDTLQSQDSLNSMFDSPQFKENLLSFQRLLSEGVFDNSLSGLKIEDFRTLKKLILFNSAKSKWVEHYQIFKDLKGKNCVQGSEVAGASIALPADYSSCVKPTQDGQHHKLSGANAVMKSPRRITTKPSFDQKELKDNDGSFFSPRRLFSSPIDNSSLVLDSSRFADESLEHELLLDVPSSGSFPQAELLLPTSSFGAQASTSSSSLFSNLSRH
ncbi:GATA transcription factor 26 [Primulina huaijiensis]|uniref:GATA transcription factor 26 n=1 Tax=Primulina huaijiensis TaxID=1492673 RepID=UPI003CC73B73